MRRQDEERRALLLGGDAQRSLPDARRQRFWRAERKQERFPAWSLWGRRTRSPEGPRGPAAGYSETHGRVALAEMRRPVSPHAIAALPMSDPNPPAKSLTVMTFHCGAICRCSWHAFDLVPGQGDSRNKMDSRSLTEPAICKAVVLSVVRRGGWDEREGAMRRELKGRY